MRYNKLQQTIYSKEEINQMIYLKKYQNKYKILQSLDGTYEIICNFGKYWESNICVYNFPLNEIKDTNTLLFSLSLKFNEENGVFIRNKHKNPSTLERKLIDLGVWYEFHQLGSNGEMSIKFKEMDLSKLEKPFKIKKRNKISPEHRKAMIERMNSARKSKGAKDDK